jgi:hypothetical protein
VSFGPTAASSYTGTLVILSNQLDNLYASVTGTGIGAGDSTPDAFSFTDQTDVALSSTITSTAITVAGIDTAAAISVSGGTYDKNASGTFTADAGTVSNGDTVRARHTSSSSNSTAVNTVVTIGGVSDTFTSTTVAAGASATDDFNRASIGSDWTTCTSSNGLAIASSIRVTGAVNGASSYAYYNATSFTQSQYSQIKFNSSTENTGPMINVTSGGAGYLTFYSGGSFYLRKYTALNTYSGNLASASGSLSSGDIVKISRSGNVITASVYHSGAWSDVVTYTDSSSPLSGGQPGLKVISNITEYDDWAGGDI